MSLDLAEEYLTPVQREHMKASGYVVVRLDSMLADQVAFASGVDIATVGQVLDTVRAVT